MRKFIVSTEKVRDVFCFILSFTILVTSYGSESNIKMRLHNIRNAEAGSMGTTNYLIKIEERYLAEYDIASSQNDKFLICQDLVRLYINDGIRNPMKIVEYATKGLPYATLPVDKCHLLVALGDAKVVIRKKNEEVVPPKSECIKPYIQALQVMYEYLHTNTLQKLPPIDRFDGPSNTNSPIYKMMTRQHQEQLVKRTQAKQQNQLLRYRSHILKQIELLYPTPNQEALEMDVNLITDDGRLVSELLRNIQIQQSD